MHLVLNHVTELKEVSDTYCSWLVKALTCLTIIEVSRAETWQTCLVSPLSQVIKLSTVEDRCSELNTKLLTGSTEDSLENLSKVHSRRHTQRVQYQVYRTTILEEWHILLTYNLRNDTLVTVTSGKLITNTDLTLLGYINLSHLQDSVWQLVTDGDSELLTLHLSIKQLVLLHEVDNQLSNELVLVLIVCPVADLYVTILKVAQSCSSKLATLGDDLSTCIVLNTL